MPYLGYISILSIVALGCAPTGGIRPGDSDTDSTPATGTDDTGSEPDTDEPPDTDAPPDTDEPPDTDDTDTHPIRTDVVGVLVDAKGALAPFTDVYCCTVVTCIKETSDATGAFEFTLSANTDSVIKTHEELYIFPRWGAAMRPARHHGVGLDLGEVYIPDLPSGVPLGDESEDPQTLTIGDGLEVTLNRADLVPELGVFLHDLAARRLPEDRVGVYGDLLGEEVVAVYAIHPFATSSRSEIAVKVPSDLDAGTRVNFRTIDYIDGRFSEPARGTADGSFVETDPGEGVTWLTYLVVTVAP